MNSYVIEIQNRRLKVVSQSASESLIPENYQLDSVQAGIDSALNAIAIHTNFVDERGQPAWGRFLPAINAGQITIEVRGTVREIYVAALHMCAGYELITPGRCGCASRLKGIQCTPLDDADTVYDVYYFDHDAMPLEDLGEKVWAYLKQSEQTKSTWRSELTGTILPSLGINLTDQHRVSIEPIRLGVLGVTGAGKSTFINALLGRQIVPQSDSICTPCLVEIRYATRGEGIKLGWFPKEEVENRLSVAKTEVNLAKTVEAVGIGKQTAKDSGLEWRDQDRQIEEAVRMYNGQTDLLPLRDLEWLADISKGRIVQRLVEKLTVFLEHPLLKHVIIIDTPGLRDPDDSRRRAALSAIGAMDGYLYLVESDNKPNESVLQDWTEVQQEANNRAGVLVLTKIDGIGPEGRTLSESLELRKDDYRGMKWKSAMVHCAARGPAILAKPLSVNPKPWEDVVELLERAGTFSLSDALFSTPQKRKGRLLVDLADKAAHDPELYRGIRDYILDASGLPAAARTLAAVVTYQMARGRRKRGYELLVGKCQERCVLARERVRDLEKLLNDCMSLENLRRNLLECTREIERLQKDIAVSSGALELLQAHSSLLSDKFLEKLEEETATLRKKLDIDLQRYLEEKKFQLVLRLDFPIFDRFDAPLALVSHRLVDEFIDGLGQSAELRHHVLAQGELTNLPDQSTIRELCKDLVAEFAPHRKDTTENKSVGVRVQVLDTYRAASEKLKDTFHASVELAATTIAGNTKSLLKQIIRRVVETGSTKLKNQKGRLPDVRKHCDDLTEGIEVLSRGLGEQNQIRIVERLDAARQELYLTNDFLKNLEIWWEKQPRDWIGDEGAQT